LPPPFAYFLLFSENSRRETLADNKEFYEIKENNRSELGLFALNADDELAIGLTGCNLLQPQLEVVQREDITHYRVQLALPIHLLYRFKGLFDLLRLIECIGAPEETAVVIEAY